MGLSETDKQILSIYEVEGASCCSVVVEEEEFK